LRKKPLESIDPGHSYSDFAVAPETPEAFELERVRALAMACAEGFVAGTPRFPATFCRELTVALFVEDIAELLVESAVDNAAVDAAAV
jgi:hypothetical protein